MRKASQNEKEGGGSHLRCPVLRRCDWKASSSRCGVGAGCFHDRLPLSSTRIVADRPSIATMDRDFGCFVPSKALWPTASASVFICRFRVALVGRESFEALL
jgi:hypothetical protein